MKKTIHFFKHFKAVTLLLALLLVAYSCDVDHSESIEQELELLSNYRTAEILEVVAEVEDELIDSNARKKGKKKKKKIKCKRPAVTKTDNCDDPIVIDFDDQGFVAGDIVEKVVTEMGNVTIYVDGENPVYLPGQNAAMIFDSSNPTGGDPDLGTPNEQYPGGVGISSDGSGASNQFALENVLIVTEDGDANDPDDLVGPSGQLNFDFSEIEGGATLVSIDVLDVEDAPTPQDAYVAMFDENDQEIKRLLIPSVGDNGFARLDLENTPGVYRLVIRLGSSGAIDNITYCYNLSNPCIDPNDPNKVAPSGVDKYNSYYFEFSNGEIVKGTSEKNTVVEIVNGKEVTLHISCSDQFLGPDEKAGTADDGYGEKDGPQEEDGVRVTKYKIWKYKIGDKGKRKGKYRSKYMDECRLVKMCEGEPKPGDNPPENGNDCLDPNDPNTPMSGVKQYYSYYFVFDNGETVKGTSEKNTVMEMVKGKAITLHVSCSDQYLGPDEKAGTADDGLGEKDGPKASDGFKVSSYKIWKYKFEDKGKCELDKICENSFN